MFTKLKSMLLMAIMSSVILFTQCLVDFDLIKSEGDLEYLQKTYNNHGKLIYSCEERKKRYFMFLQSYYFANYEKATNKKIDLHSQKSMDHYGKYAKKHLMPIGEQMKCDKADVIIFELITARTLEDNGDFKKFKFSISDANGNKLKEAVYSVIQKMRYTGSSGSGIEYHTVYMIKIKKPITITNYEKSDLPITLTVTYPNKAKEVYALLK